MVPFFWKQQPWDIFKSSNRFKANIKEVWPKLESLDLYDNNMEGAAAFFESMKRDW